MTLGSFKMLNVFAIFQIIISTSSTLSLPEDRCRFVRSWRGRWYQNEDRLLGIVNIREDAIEGLGSCYARHNKDFYILETKISDTICYKCLLFIQRHENILQFRESFCLSQASYNSLCKAITVETPLYTLLRVDAGPSQCPQALSGEFSLTYRNNTEIDCYSPTSKMTSCSNGRHLTFCFGACKVLGTQSQEFTVDCLASWKDGARTYLYTRVDYSPNSRVGQHIHRCFVYEENGPGLRMSLSADASCRAYMTMTLSQGVHSRSCTFPSWMAGYNWTEAAGQNLHLISESKVTLYKLKQNGGGEGLHLGRVSRIYTCLSSTAMGLTDTVVAVVVSHRCTVYYQCLRYQRLEANVIEMSLGAKSQTPIHDCVKQMSLPNRTHSHTLLVKDNTSGILECRLQGVFKTSLSRPSSEVQRHCSLSSVIAGCSTPSEITLYAEDEWGQIAPETYGCVAQWSRDGVEYCVMQTDEGKHTCLVYEQKEAGDAVISVNNVCHRNEGDLCPLAEKSEPCPSHQRKSQQSSDIQMTIMEDMYRGQGTSLTQMGPIQHSVYIVLTFVLLLLFQDPLILLNFY